ncbi:MAG TPA: DUF349 domain-containing protein [Actinomycetaceae bacterium]|nr:DUF349 domain-containing protein [Actinomycetaceae bacterium]
MSETPTIPTPDQPEEEAQLTADTSLSAKSETEEAAELEAAELKVVAPVDEETVDEETVEDTTAGVTPPETAAEETVTDAEAMAEEAPVPQVPTPAPPAPAPEPAHKVQHVEVPLDPHELAEASVFGRVAEDGTVYVREAAGERVVGQFPGATETEALTFYVRRFVDLAAQVRLFEARIPLLSSRDLQNSLTSLREQVKEPQAVGDLDGLRQRIEHLEERVQQRRAEIQEEREAARAEALTLREEIVSLAEAISAQDVTRTQWRDSGENLHGLLEQWKTAQRSGPRLDKAKEDELWKRFSKARTMFDRNRRQFFAERDAEHAGARAAKEALIARAEALSSSTDWGPTSAEYRELMREWKTAGRARRKDDDQLWARFRAAQQVFFDAREAQNQAIDQEYGANLEVKLQILEEAEALLPVKDAREARSAMRLLEERWDAAGRVPRSEVQRVEGRMRAVDKAIKDVEDAEWRRSNPETTARVNSATVQLEAAIASLEDDLTKAKKKGDARGIKNAEEALAARKAWLEQIRRSSL